MFIRSLELDQGFVSDQDGEEGQGEGQGQELLEVDRDPEGQQKGHPQQKGQPEGQLGEQTEGGEESGVGQGKGLEQVDEGEQEEQEREGVGEERVGVLRRLLEGVVDVRQQGVV